MFQGSVSNLETPVSPQHYLEATQIVVRMFQMQAAAMSFYFEGVHVDFCFFLFLDSNLEQYFS